MNDAPVIVFAALVAAVLIALWAFNTGANFACHDECVAQLHTRGEYSAGRCLCLDEVP